MRLFLGFWALILLQLLPHALPDILRLWWP